MPSRLQRYFRYYAAEGSNDERIRKSINGHEAALREGRYTFQPPIGYMRGKIAGIHEINPEIGPYIKHALISIANNTMDIKQAMDWYNANCRLIVSGKHTKMRMDKWRRYITNPYYAGIVEMHKQICVRNENGLHEALITKEQHERILETVKHKKKLHKGPIKGGNRRFPLNQILFCEECATKNNKSFKFTGADSNNGHTDKIYSNYRCRGCNKSLSREEAHKQISHIISGLDYSDKGRKAIVEALNNIWNDEEKGLKLQLSLYRTDLTKLEEKKEKISDQLLNTDNEKLRKEFTIQLGKMLENIESQNIKISSAERELEKGRTSFLKFALEFIDNMGAHFFELPLESIGVCKNILFPGGFWMGPDKIIYTTEISPLYRERTTKMGPLKPENCPMVGRKRLELLTFSV